MGKTLHHYSQQIRAMAPDALAVDRARELGMVLIEAKAAVKAAGRKWGEWLDADCALSHRSAQRFMAIARRWGDPGFVAARQDRPDLPLREADRILAGASNRKRSAPEQPDPYQAATGKVAGLEWELQLLSEIPMAHQCAGPEIKAAQEALRAVRVAVLGAGPGH